MKNIKKLLIIFTSILMIFMLSACKSENKSASEDAKKTQTASEDKKQDLQEVNVVLDWYPNAVHSFIYDAIEKGYYENEGLKVNIIFPSNANDAISLTAAGKAQIGIYYPHDVIQTYANQDIPIKAIGSIVQKPLNIVLSLKEKNITKPEDFVGKTIGYAGTQLSEDMIKSMVKSRGLDPDSVNLLDVGFELMTAMTTNKVDATIGCLVNHEVPQMEEEGFELNYFSVDEYGMPSFPELVFVTSDDYIKNDKEMLVKFLNASKKGFEDMKNKPDETLKILLDNQNEENFPLSQTVEEKSMNTLLPLMETDTDKFLSQNKEDWQNTINWMKEQEIIKKDVQVDEVVVDLVD